ncbi:hypothetical protein ACNOYE_37495 [Nannocystaceae bacterium ST9]
MRFIAAPDDEPRGDLLVGHGDRGPRRRAKHALDSLERDQSLALVVLRRGPEQDVQELVGRLPLREQLTELARHERQVEVRDRLLGELELGSPCKVLLLTVWTT